VRRVSEAHFPRRVRAAYVYANPRRAPARDVAAGLAPDTGLLGQNHLAPLGIEATVHDSALTRRERRDGYPYGSEASGLTAFLEAAASGKAVVASERAILRDYLEPGRSGLTVSPENSQALRLALERVLGDQRLAAGLGTAARKDVERRFTTRHLAERLAPFRREAAGG